MYWSGHKSKHLQGVVSSELEQLHKSQNILYWRTSLYSSIKFHSQDAQTCKRQWFHARQISETLVDFVYLQYGSLASLIIKVARLHNWLIRPQAMTAHSRLQINILITQKIKIRDWFLTLSMWNYEKVKQRLNSLDRNWKILDGLLICNKTYRRISHVNESEAALR